MVLLPLLVFMVCCGLGLFGVLTAANRFAQAEKTSALDTAATTAQQIRLQILQVPRHAERLPGCVAGLWSLRRPNSYTGASLLQGFGPTLALRSLIVKDPTVPWIVRDMPTWLGPELMSHVGRTFWAFMGLNGLE